ncbi:alpha/beta hydrolase [bacterium]|nr:alpha/beta hydrolase [bacterium]
MNIATLALHTLYPALALASNLLAAAPEQFKQRDRNNDGVLHEGTRQEGTRTPMARPTFADVPYGPYERTVLDFWKANSSSPTPVVVYIHGGGFVGGDKRSIPVVVVDDCLSNGVSVAAIHYRFVTTAPFPAPQHDGARAIQFLRSKATGWNIDPTRIAAFGGSAGAGISLWLAFHDDLAQTNSADPVARQSTRIACVGSFGGQPSYDPFVIKEWVGGRAYLHPSIFKCYGVPLTGSFDRAKLQPLFDECAALTHLTKDDPPVIMFYSEPDAPLPPDSPPGTGIHHPVFGHKLKKAMDDLGIESVYYHRSDFKENPHKEMLAFFFRHFGMKTTAAPHAVPGAEGATAASGAEGATGATGS